MSPVAIRPLPEEDLDEADRIFRLAFGTFIGLPDPMAFMGDADLVRTRWRADPESAFGAYMDGALVGSNFASNWGSVGFFGPLTVRPDMWSSGVGKGLMEPVLARFDAWHTRVAGLFTFPHSTKHIGLYRKFGFSPRFLTAMMSKAVAPLTGPRVWTKFSEAPPEQHEKMLAACRALTDAVYPGLDVTPEIRSIFRQHLGDTLLLWRNDRLMGLAVCHTGRATEAGTGACYVKFAAVRPDEAAATEFDALLSACEAYAADCVASRLVAGVNTARHEAHSRMVAHGFRADMHGVAMHRPNDAGYSRPGTFLIDDWR